MNFGITGDAKVTVRDVRFAAAVRDAAAKFRNRAFVLYAVGAGKAEFVVAPGWPDRQRRKLLKLAHDFIHAEMNHRHIGITR